MFKIKDAYPKKVCHIPTRHVKKKEGEKKKRREKNSPYPKKKKKKKKQEGDDSYKGVHPPSTKNIFPHTCTS